MGIADCIGCYLIGDFEYFDDFIESGVLLRGYDFVGDCSKDMGFTFFWEALIAPITSSAFTDPIIVSVLLSLGPRTFLKYASMC